MRRLWRRGRSALRALELEPRDLRAQHTLLHVYEMVGQPEEGLRWAGRHALQWCGDAAVAPPVVARRALHDRGRAPARSPGDLRPAASAGHARRADRRLGAPLAAAPRALRRRRALRSPAAGGHAEDAYCAFNDLHAMMAFAGAERWDLAQRLLAAQERRIGLPGANRDMTRLVGYPACRAARLRAARFPDRRGAAAFAAPGGAPHRRQPRPARRAAATRAAALARRSTTRTGETNVFLYRDALPQLNGGFSSPTAGSRPP